MRGSIRFTDDTTTVSCQLTHQEKGQLLKVIRRLRLQGVDACQSSIARVALLRFLSTTHHQGTRWAKAQLEENKQKEAEAPSGNGSLFVREILERGGDNNHERS